MDVYHKILVKLYEVSDGRDSKKVDFADLVKKEGFYPSYKDIYKQMSQSGWIAEAGRTDVVNITHWGLMEAKKVLAGGGDSSKELEKRFNRLKANSKEFLVTVEDFGSDMNSESLQQVRDKFDEVENAISKLKELV